MALQRRGGQGITGRAIDVANDAMEKPISLFLLIFILAVLLYIMWVISREYPFELAFRDQKVSCCNYYGASRGLQLDLRGVTAFREVALLGDATLRNGRAA